MVLVVSMLSKNNNNRRVFITGIGCVSCAGLGKSKFLDILKNGISIPVEFPEFTGNLPPYFSKKCFLVKDFHLDEIRKLEKELNFNILDNLSEKEKEEKSYMFALYATLEAIIDAGIEPQYLQKNKVGISMAASLSGNRFLEKFILQYCSSPPIIADGSLLWYGVADVGTFLARCLEIKGPTYLVSTACASGANSIGIGYDLIRSGICDIVIAGGTDFLTPLVMAGFSQLQSISKSIIKPFSKKRNGTMLGEGAAVVVLQSEELAVKDKIYAEITGYSILNDAYHITAADPTGISIEELMLKTIEVSNKSLDDTNYINAHGTGTIANDITEAKAILGLFGNKCVYVNSTKSVVGHLLAAAGAIETIATALQIKNSFIAPTANVYPDEVIEGINLVIRRIDDIEIKFALKISLGFGGNGCCLGLSKFY